MRQHNVNTQPTNKALYHVLQMDEGVVMAATGLPAVDHDASQSVLGAHSLARLISRGLLVIVFTLPFATQLLLQLLLTTVVKVIIIIN